MYDVVRVCKDLGKSMSHFSSDCDAVVVKICGDNKQYGLYIRGKGFSAWYHESQLALIKSSSEETLREFENEVESIKKMRSDISWIFNNGKEIVKDGVHSETVNTLAKLLGKSFKDSSNGEMFNYIQHAQYVCSIARPFLEKCDKDGFLEYAKSINKEK